MYVPGKFHSSTKADKFDEKWCSFRWILFLSRRATSLRSLNGLHRSACDDEINHDKIDCEEIDSRQNRPRRNSCEENDWSPAFRRRLFIFCGICAGFVGFPFQMTTLSAPLPTLNVHLFGQQMAVHATYKAMPCASNIRFSFNTHSLAPANARDGCCECETIWNVK